MTLTGITQPGNVGSTQTMTSSGSPSSAIVFGIIP